MLEVRHCIGELQQHARAPCGGVNVNMAQSVCQWGKTIHANLLPQTGVQLGQSGGESSGVERVQRSPDQGLDCSWVIYSWEQKWRQHWWRGCDSDSPLTWHPCTDVHRQMCRRVNTHSHTQAPKHCPLVLVTAVLGSALPGFTLWPKRGPRGLHLTCCILLTTHKPKQLSKPLPMNSAQMKQITVSALQWHM